MRLAALSAAMCCVIGIDAQDSLLTHRIEEIVVTADKSRRANVFETTPIQSISGEDIRMMGLQNLADAVKKFAGTTVKDYGGIGGMKTVSVRNLGAQHTAVSYDGVTVSNTQAGQIDIGRLSLDNVGLLSMAVGQGSDIMQSARHYASAAILSIVTEQPMLDKGERQLSLGLTGGSWGQVNPKLRYWQGVGKGTTASFEADFMRADGIYPFKLTNGTVVTEERRNNSDISQWHVEGNLLRQFSDSSRLALKAYFYRSERGLPGSVVLYNDKAKERLWDENFFAQTTYEKSLGKQWQLAVRAKYTHTWNLYEDTDVKYSDGKFSQTNRQDEYYASATLGWRPAKWLEMALAEDVAFNKLHTTVNGSPNPLRFTSLTALAAKARWGRLTVEGNLVATFAKESLTESEKYAIKTPDDRKKLSPSLSLNFRILPDEALYLRALVKQTFRMPTFNDLYYLQIGNTSLRPENANEYGIGMTWNSRRWGFMKYLTLTVDGYYNNVTDKIVAFPSTYVWKMVNFGKAEAKGIDATLGTELDLTKGFGLTASGTLTLQDAKDKTESSATYGSQLPYTPKKSGGLSALVTTPWLNIGYSATGQGKRYSLAQNTRQYLLDTYMEHSLSVSRQLNIKRVGELTLQLTLHNFTNKQYEIIKYYPMPGRSVTANVVLKIKN
ncbi:MAG: TonB-dependent receptor plug domain-containing protein [Prevotella sp.]